MKYDDAVDLSKHLALHGYGHQLVVGVHDQMAPRLTCRIDVPHPRNQTVDGEAVAGFTIDWDLDQLTHLDDLAKEFGARMRISRLAGLSAGNPKVYVS